MRKKSMFIIGFLCLVLYGCAGSKEQATATTSNSNEAIAASADMSTTQEQIDFLVKEADGFIAEGKYQDAGLVAEHILGNLDVDSPDAIRIQHKAYKELQNSLLEKK